MDLHVCHQLQVNNLPDERVVTGSLRYCVRNVRVTSGTANRRCMYIHTCRYIHMCALAVFPSYLSRHRASETARSRLLQIR